MADKPLVWLCHLVYLVYLVVHSGPKVSQGLYKTMGCESPCPHRMALGPETLEIITASEPVTSGVQILLCSLTNSVFCLLGPTELVAKERWV